MLLCAGIKLDTWDFLVRIFSGRVAVARAGPHVFEILYEVYLQPPL